MKKKSNLSLFFIFLVIVSFLIYVAFRNEKKYAPAPSDDKINIKQNPDVIIPIDNVTQGKG